jgi:hypothetical protein
MKLRYFASVARTALWLSVLASYNGVATLAFQPDPTVGRVISIEPANPPGKLRVKQGRKEHAADATLGMTVRRGQVLTLAADARAAIYCPDGKTYDLKPGQSQGCPCTSPSRGLVYNRGVIPGTRGHDTSRGDFPVVLSPRKGFLLTTGPAIRWSPVTSLRPDEVIVYSVTMTTEAGKQLWRREGVTGTELGYPADAPRLARGEGYKVIVQFGRKTSAQEAATDVGFTVVTDTDAEAVRDAESAARLLKLPELQERLVVADLYASQELSSEAIEMLTGLTKTLKEPAVLRLLGDLYAASGLHPEAVRQYELALTLPQIRTDLEGQALTLGALGRSYAALGNREQANVSFARALDAYQKLGERLTIEQLR